MKKNQVKAINALAGVLSSINFGDIKSSSAQRLAALQIHKLPFEKIQSVVIDWKVLNVDGAEELMPTVEIKSFTTRVEEVYP